jgi:DNA-binding NarL/FixJ family response regulator
MKDGKLIRVVVIDDHQIMRDGLRVLMEKDSEIQIAGEASDALDGVELAARIRPDVILLDIGMRGLDGIQAAHRLRKEAPGSRIIILSQYEDQEYVLEALGKAGASGYAIKSEGGSELLGAIRAVAAGKRYISPAVAPIVIDKLKRNARRANDGNEDGNEMLTRREREILRLIAEGSAIKEIANRLGISPKTVQVHRGNLAAKLRLPSTAAIVQYAIKHKMLKLD